MKFKKTSLITLFTIGLAVSSNNSMANVDDEIMDYALAAGNSYLVPKISRDLGKNVQIIRNTDRNSPFSLKLVIPNATCENYIEVLTRSRQLYSFEFIADRMEEDENYNKAEMEKEFSSFKLFSLSLGMISGELEMNPMFLVGCESTIKKMSGQYESSPVFLKLKKDSEKVGARIQKLEAQGRFK